MRLIGSEHLCPCHVQGQFISPELVISKIQVKMRVRGGRREEAGNEERLIKVASL